MERYLSDLLKPVSSNIQAVDFSLNKKGAPRQDRIGHERPRNHSKSIIGAETKRVIKKSTVLKDFVVSNSVVGETSSSDEETAIPPTLTATNNLTTGDNSVYSGTVVMLPAATDVYETNHEQTEKFEGSNPLKIQDKPGVMNIASSDDIVVLQNIVAAQSEKIDNLTSMVKEQKETMATMMNAITELFKKKNINLDIPLRNEYFTFVHSELPLGSIADMESLEIKLQEEKVVEEFVSINKVEFIFS
ncbi:hypothetical protein FQR65_LT19564 [Abscondita terminalis]|nr:hypothetical protein FQR65_LT19564 [Abscondita terminalis]